MPKVSEHAIVTVLATWIRRTYPAIPFRFDLAADMPLPPKYARRLKDLHGDHSRGHPDLIIYGPGGKPYFLELKATATVPDNEHTRRQRAYHKMLKDLGYKVSFACGLEQAQKKISNYLKKAK